MSDVRVAVLRGGPSDEYRVSLQSGQSVLDALNTNRYRPIDVVITRGGEWLVEGYEKYPEQVLTASDVVFNALHGTYGEDGTIQQLIERYGIPHTGSRVFPSRIAINKVLTKDYLRELDIKMAPHMVVTQNSSLNLHGIAESIAHMFGPEYVIKPVASGSSVGVMIVENAALLPRALKDALQYYDEVMVEKRIRGREITCGVINNFRGSAIYTLPPMEIIVSQKEGYLSHDAKYNESTEKICPGSISVSEKSMVEDIAKKVHAHLGLSQYSRSDFIVASDGVYFLEVNTLPGLTKTSLLPSEMTSVGIEFPLFVDHVLTDSIEGVR